MQLLSIPRLRKQQPPLLALDMFNFERTREEALRARRLETLYHVGQEKIWDGRKVLADLAAKHGKITVADAPRKALARVFSIIMWGELAAWKVSAQLAEQIVPLEAKMAATSQAHDEARHFYVMHDYLELLGLTPPPLEFFSRAVVEMAIEADDLAQKLAGMQLQVETIALTIFHKVRVARIEPVLSELLEYYELDEARHVGLGVQFLPDLIRRMTPLEHTRFVLFQLRMLVYSLFGLKVIEKDLEVLGIDPRELVAFGAQKQLGFLCELARESGENPTNDWAGKILDTTCEMIFPSRKQAKRHSVTGALWRAIGAFEVLTGRLEGIGESARHAVNQSAERGRKERERLRDVLPIVL